MAHKPEFPPLLAFGFHHMSVADLHRLTVRQFPLSARRAPLWDNLIWLIDELTRLQIACTLWVDGSFLTEKIDPDDIDFVACIDFDALNSLSPDQDAFVQSLSDQVFKDTRNLHSFVMFSAPQGHPAAPRAQQLEAQWVRDFGFSYVAKTPKGIALVGVAP